MSKTHAFLNVQNCAASAQCDSDPLDRVKGRVAAFEKKATDHRLHKPAKPSTTTSKVQNIKDKVVALKDIRRRGGEPIYVDVLGFYVVPGGKGNTMQTSPASSHFQTLLALRYSFMGSNI